MWIRKFHADREQENAIKDMIAKAAYAKSRGSIDISIHKLVEVLQSDNESLYVLNKLVNGIEEY